MRGISGFYCILAALLWLLPGCAKPVPPELEQGMAVVEYMTSARFLSKSMFYAAYPAGKPSQFVSYLFSDIGAAEWPVALSPEEAAVIRVPRVPENVRFVPRQHDGRTGFQIVLKADDTRSVVIAQAYEAPGNEPILSREFQLARTEVDPLARQMYESNRQMGASPMER